MPREAHRRGRGGLGMTRLWIGIAAAAALLAGCAEPEAILPGERLDLRPEAAAAALPSGARAISLAPPVALAEWTHTNATPEHNAPHAALRSTPVPVWSAPIGLGNDRRHRITASPVVAGGRVFTLDSRATVAAHDTAGRPLWRRDLTPPGERADDASGGGLALGGGRLFVTTGFGELVALDAATGREAWTQRLGAAATGTPTVRGDLVYAVGRDGIGWAVEVATGRVRYEVVGTPDVAGVVGPAGPAVSEELAVFPFGSGALAATYREGGTPAWTAAVVGARLGRAYRDLTEVTGDPVFAGGRVYAGNATGRIVALDAATGAPIWTAREGAYGGPVWPAGDSVFAVTDVGSAVRLDAADGSPIWETPLPGFVRQRPNRRKAVFAHYGPVLAGGILWIASSDGALRGLDPVSGAVVRLVPLPGGAATAPAVAGGTLYVVSADGRLIAYR